MRVRPTISGCLLGALILSTAATTASFGQAVTTAFTFQGVLKNSGAPLNGNVDLRFTLWDAAAAGNQVGVPVAVNAATLTNGLITTTLDFGVSAFGGSQRWLQVEVDTTPGGGAGPFVILTPRQPLTAVPYAMFALAGAGQWTPNGSALNYQLGNVSVGTANQNARMTIYSTGNAQGTQTSLYVRNTDVVNQSVAGSFIADSGHGIALAASNLGTGGNGRAISASIASSTGTGIYSYAPAPTGSAKAIHGEAVSATGWAGYFEGRGHFSSYTYIGRETGINSTEIFGVRAPVASGFGGMYVDTMGATALPYYGYATAGVSRMWTAYEGTTGKWHVANGGNRLTVQDDGLIGINTTSPQALLHVNGTSDSEPTGGGVLVIGSTSSGNISIDGNEIMARSAGGVSTLFLNNDGGDVTISPGGTGKLICKVVQITGGADLSEQFEVNAADIQPEPGMVVVIDPANPGELVPASTAYDKKVAGVISGAGGVATGMMMGHTGTIADGAHAIALTGRVYCLADATDSAIEPGDMLTTSATPGHAMKALDAERSHGAIIGKAMTALPHGEKGLVLVLVNLQ